MKFSLMEIAWFDRCFFFDDCKQGLIDNGIDQFEAHSITSHVMKNKMSITQMYQEYITDKNVTDAIENMVKSFIEKGKQ